MKKIMFLSIFSCLLVFQGCSRKDNIVQPKVATLAKQTESLPAGYYTAGALPTGTYKFLTYESTLGTATPKYVGVVGGSTTPGALIEQRDFAGTVQEWRITQTGFGTYSIVNYNSGLAIEDQNAAQTQDNPIIQNTFSGAAKNEWVIEPESFYVYRIKSVVNLNMGTHVAGGSTANGADLKLETFTGGTNQGWGYFYAYQLPISPTPITINTPDATHTNTYPRLTRLTNGDLLASFQVDTINNGISVGIIKFYKSTNGGSSWTALSTLKDTHRSLGLWEATPYVTPVALGSLPAGTLLCPVRSFLWVSHSFIDVYKSTDGGATWSYYSSIAQGNGPYHNIFEPYFLVNGSNQLTCYYSDERDSSVHSQKLVYQLSGDGGATWSGTVHDAVALPKQSDRPGMFQACKMGNGKWIMTYEYVGAPNISQVFYKTSTDGITWDSATSSPGTGISTISGETPGGSPTVLWTPAGSTDGTVIITSLADFPSNSRGSDNIINTQYNTGNWISVPQPLTYTYINSNVSGYSRSACLSADGKTLYHINCVATNGVNAKVEFVATPAW